MSHIKFRAWTGKKMFMQDDQYLASFIRRAVSQICMDHDETSWGTKTHESYLPNGGNIEEYLMQYTGLKDIHGQEIYEGDIVIATKNYTQAKKPMLFVSTFRNNTATFAFREALVNSDGDKYYYDKLQIRDIEVICNIHENPEMVDESD